MRANFCSYFFEASLLVPALVHLVDDNYNARDAQNAQNFQMPQRLRANSFMSVDDQNSSFSAGCAGGHVLQEFEVTGSIDEKKAISIEIEIDTRRVNTDPLLLLFLKRIEEEGRLQLNSARFADLPHLFDSLLRNFAEVHEQTT